MAAIRHLSIFLGFLVCTSESLFRSGRPRARESCNTERTEMDITRTMSVTYNGEQKTVECVARVRVNECEGVCLSTASPNFNSYPDFNKDCKCCREGSLVTRQITLQECYDNGVVLAGVQPTTTIAEPTNCACFPCTN
ncbi:partner of bursicon-like [Ostrea edulis]|uniref:partner of bursicon-like n=1 Tax=Ostrea edulis TaxID=37623 RepID=UPI002094370D|nr:partner of bursicon-like [Ostrea edulis]